MHAKDALVSMDKATVGRKDMDGQVWGYGLTYSYNDNQVSQETNNFFWICSIGEPDRFPAQKIAPTITHDAIVQDSGRWVRRSCC